MTQQYYPVRGAIPPALALTLRMQPAVDPVHGPRPVAQTDPAARAVALLEESPPAERPAPVRRADDEPTGPSVRIGEVPPPCPEAPGDLGRIRRLFTPPPPRDPLAPPPRRL